MVDQADIFQPLAQHSHYAELCTVLYERELAYLAQLKGDETNSLRWFQARIRSLPYYVRRAARGMLASNSPLQLDVQNGSWQGAQKRQLTRSAQAPQRLQQWLQKHAALGIVLPLMVASPIRKQVLLDSIDRIDREQQRIHLNQWGWFYFDGRLAELDAPMYAFTSEQQANLEIHLLKPEKSSLTAACAGHQWNHKGKTDPRTLNLREILLAATIDWDGPQRVVRIPDTV